MPATLFGHTCSTANLELGNGMTRRLALFKLLWFTGNAITKVAEVTSSVYGLLKIVFTQDASSRLAKGKELGGKGHSIHIYKLGNTNISDNEKVVYTVFVCFFKLEWDEHGNSIIHHFQKFRFVGKTASISQLVHSFI